LKPKIFQKVFKNSDRTSKRTPHFTITKINWLRIFEEITAVYTENHTEIQNAVLIIVKAEGIDYIVTIWL
jgi:hypothetical protein